MWLRRLFESLYGKLLTLNLFESRLTDPSRINHELVSTRLYLLSMIVSISILTYYRSIYEQIKEDTVYYPKFDFYNELKEKYSDTLKCPCGKVAIPYGRFVNVTSIFHQVCSSDFVSDSWIDLTFPRNLTLIWPMDIRRSLSSMWQIIAGACSNSRKLVSDAINEYSNSTLFNSVILSEDLVEMKAHSALDLTLGVLSNSSMKLLTAFEKISLSNALMTGLSTNYVLRTYSYVPGGNADELIAAVVRYILPGSNRICSCMHSGTCPMMGSFYLYDMWETAGLYDLNRIISNETISDLTTDCTPLQMVFSSSLECFYNQSCVDLIQSIYSKEMTNISILNQSLESRFLQTTKIKYLIEEHFIEKIFNKSRYKDYYEECAPIYCSFARRNRFDGIFVLTILMSLYGGLSVGLRILIPHLVDFIFFLKKKCLLNRNQSEQKQNVSMLNRLKNVLNKMRRFLIELNIHNSHSQGLIGSGNDRISTRLSLIFILIALTIATVYTSISMQSINKTISNPSIEEYEEVQEKYSNTLKCPCRRISIVYKEFVSFVPSYHQICESDFVQSNWYESFPISEHGQWADQLFIGSSHFRTLATLCHLAKLTIDDESDRFRLRIFTNNEILSRQIFVSKFDSLVKKFVNSTRLSFSTLILLITRFLHGNQYLNGLETNFEYQIDPSYPSLDFSQLNRSRIVTSSRNRVINRNKTMYCAQNASTMLSNGINDTLIASSMRTDCWIVNSVLESTLACWFNRSCLEEYRQLLSKFNFSLNTNVTILDRNLRSRFSSDVRVESLVNELMIEEWNFSISYEKYYDGCRPSHCSYRYEKRPNIWYIITSAISFLGGLHFLSWLILPRPIRFVFEIVRRINANRLSSPSTIQKQTNIRTRCCQRNLLSNLMKINLFSSGSTEINMIRRERLITKLYLLCLIVGLCLILVLTLTSKEKTIKKVFNPSEGKYEELLKRYSVDVQCPCQQISIPYRNLVEINNSFHQICQSDFVDEKWIEFLFDDGRWRNYHRTDFRIRGSAYFHLLSHLCQISQTIVSRSIEQFLDDVFLSSSLLSPFEFSMNMNLTIEQFQSDIPIRFSRDLQLLEDLSQGNTYISGYQLNWYWWMNDSSDNRTLPTNVIQLEDGCSCGTKKDCLINSNIFDSNTQMKYFEIAGWHIGCSVIQTLLSSTFECFYNQTCLDLLIHFMKTIHPKLTNQIQIKSLNSSQSSRFNNHTFIHQIINNLFIEQWMTNVSYHSFYQQCSPIYCSYSKATRTNYFYIISRIFTLLGGLSAALKFILPLFINLARKMKACCCCCK